MGDDLKIYFVKLDNNGENSKTLGEAFEALNKAEYNFKLEWITSQECLLADGTGKPLYIFDPFEGEAFEHIKKCGYRIYGPRCILANQLHGIELPNSKKQPIYNVAMKDVKVCCTSLEGKLRDEITEKVCLMAGKVDRHLTEDVTHLIAGEVGSNKYLVAVEKGKQVMVKEWVLKVWELSKDRHVLATDEIFQKYTCPPFMGFTVVVSGFRPRERSQLRDFIIRGGGKYSGELKMKDCTHLIVKEPQGAKYEAAKNWHIKIVKDRWLFDCMDKGRYLDTKPYQFSVKTSTPERKSAVGPSISDISAISLGGLNSSHYQVDETTDLSSSTRYSDRFSVTGLRNTLAETKIGNTMLEADMTTLSSDVFLDGCKIYLSGIKPAVQEKLRKIITAGCGLRCMEINDNTTHVVIGEVVASDILLLNGLPECPHVVTTDWLFECFRLNTHISEEKYVRADLGLKLPAKYRSTDSVQGSKSTHKGLTNKGGKDKKKNDRFQEIQAAFEMDAPSDLEMAELLSQYMEPKEVSKPDAMVGDEVHISAKPGSSTQDTTLKPQDLEEDDLTQDPHGVSEDVADNGIFHKLKFVILGFDEGEMEQLTILITEKGGCILPCGKTRQVADIAVVPLMGFPVDVTVSEILTNAWLQMCVEMDELLPYDGWLSRPIEVPETDPLEGCCLCVSGYVGVERECIVHLAQLLGASCQDHFARKGRKDLQANTHLVVNYPSGSKYEAAMKWQIPAVGREWISACIKSGQRVPEDDFLIDVLEEKRLQAVSAVTDPVRVANTSTTSLPTPPKACENIHSTDDEFVERKDTSFEKEENHVGANLQENHVGGNLNVTEKVVNIKSSKDTIQCEAKNDEVAVLEEHTEKQFPDRVPSSSAESSDPGNRNPPDMNPMAEIQLHLLTPSLSNNKNRSSGRKSACRPNQSENITAGHLKTPVDIRRQKWGNLSNGESPATSTPLGLIKGGGETPGTFMQPNFKPKFNIAGFFDTPECTADLNKSTPLGETFRRQITKAVQNILAQNPKSTEVIEGEMPVSQSQQDHLAPLHGVVIAVAKKLGHNHEQYNSIVVELGGNYSWQNGPHVTHFVFQGRPNDTNKEFRKARDERKTIVSPYWLFICKEQNCRVDESLFPHNYNPNFSLTLTPSSKLTPSRSSRAALRNRGQLEPSAKAVAVNGRTPNRKLPVLNLQKVAEKDGEMKSSKVADADETTSPTDHNNTKKDISQLARTSGEDCTEDENVSDEELAGKGIKKGIKEALSKTLGNIVAEASKPQGSVKRKTKVPRLSGQLTTSDSDTPQSCLPRTGITGHSSKEAPIDGASNEVIIAPEIPHSEKVTWEDPTENILKAQLARQLEHIQEPSQNLEYVSAAKIPTREANEQEAGGLGVRSGTRYFADDRSPTPEPPSLAFPIAKPSSAIMSPQPIELISEESSESRMSASSSARRTRIFLVSGLQNQDRVDYSALVEQFGGKTIEKQNFDPACTHLVINQPSRNEKYLSCLASGKWILHKSYFEECRKEGKFVKEEPHEWGSSFTQPLMQNMAPSARKLASAAYKWRRKVAAIKKMDPSCEGAYNGWKVLLCLDKTKEDNFMRLLEAGGAKVSVIRSPFPDNLQATHAFVDLTKVKISQEDLQKLLEADIHCLKPEYIPAFLTEEPPPDPSEFYPADFMALKASLPEPVRKQKRRRTSDENTSVSKISRR